MLTHVLLDISQAPGRGVGGEEVQLWLLQICIAKKKNTLLDYVGLVSLSLHS